MSFSPTARAAMWALRKSGVKFRTRANDGCELGCRPELPGFFCGHF